MKLIFESTEMASVTPRKLNRVEIRFVTMFQDMLRIVKNIPKEVTLKQLYKYKEQLDKYRKFPFSEPIINIVDAQIQFGEEILLARGSLTSEYYNNALEKFDDVVDRFMSGDYDGVLSHTDFVSGFNNTISKSSRDENKLSFSNPLLKSTNIFNMGQGDRLITDFDFGDMDSIINKDISKFCYTIMNLPKTRLDEPDFLIYFIQELKDNAKPVRIKTGDMRKQSKLNDADTPEYDELVKMVDAYLHSNNKEIIPQILTLIKKMDSLYKANERSKKKIKTVYRGIKGKYDKEDLAAMDRKQGFVATTLSYGVAKRFATNRGWIMRNPDAEVEGRILVYNVDYNSIILDTQIFGSAFQEAEVIIDAKKAKLVEVEYVYPGD
jgi:hypothetical protein